MKCQEARDLFFLYHDSELDSRSVQDVNLHLETCQACREHWDREERLEEALSRAAWRSAVSVEGFPWTDLEARIRADGVSRAEPATQVGTGDVARRSGLRWRSAAAAFLLLGLTAVLAGWYLYRPDPSVAAVARSAYEHHQEYLAGKSPVQVRGPDVEAVRNFYAGQLGFEVLVPDALTVASALDLPTDLVGARRCTFLGGPVAYVTYRIGERDVTVILGPVRPPEATVDAISRSPGGILERTVEDCRILIATVRGVLFVAAGRTDPHALRHLLAAFQR
ncbi:MAG: anti-sigma factor family protein [Planctomycetota bacterium]